MPTAIVVTIVISAIILIAVSYVKAAPDTALIISGLRRTPKILIGKAGLRIPFLERLDRLPLELMQIDVQSRNSVPTAEFIDVKIDGVANIKISKDPEFIQRAAQHFLNMKPEQISVVAKENLEGNLREIVGQMKLEELLKERDKFAEKVRSNATGDMSNMGFEIVNFTVQDIKDDHGAIRDMGVDNLEQIKKIAAIAKAQAEKEVKIERAKNDQLGNEARAQADAEIAKQNRDLEIKRASFKREEDEAKSKAEAAAEIERENQQRTINENAVNAEIMKAERTTDLTLKNVAIEKNRLDAEIKAKADADRYAKQQAAEADRFAKEQAAEAMKKQRILDAEAKKEEMLKEAEGIKAVGEAEATAIEARGIAEAKAIELKAEAMLKMQDAAVIEMALDKLPLIAEAIAKPLGSIDNLTLYDPNGTTELQKTVTAGINQVFDSASAAGIDLKSLVAGMIGGNIASKTNKPTPEEEPNKNKNNTDK